MPTDIFQFFACFTNLPIPIDVVRDQALEYGVADDIVFSEVQTDPDYLLGMHRLYKDERTGKVTAHVFYSSAIQDESYRRLVCCKEILHVLDNDDATAKSRDAVSRLINQIVVPPSSGITNSAKSDHNGMLWALMVLLPRDALSELRPHYENGDLSVEDIAILADIPEHYARFALSDIWTEIVESY